ncbi:hypothetical protein QTP88_025092 [Uroleucon formosanum]
MINYLDQEFTKVDLPPKTPEEMIVFIKNLSDDKIIESNPKEDMNFISQLKMYASPQLAEQWAQRWSGENSPELFTESEVRLISPLPPPQYSNMSPMHEDLSQAADEDRGINDFLAQINTTQATWAPTKSLPIDNSTNLPPVIIDNHSTGHDSDNITQYPLCARIEFCKERAKKIRQDYNLANEETVVVHWDGKLLPALTGKVDRLPIVASVNGHEQLLGVPALNTGTGSDQANAVYQTLVEWCLTENIQAFCSDTTASNTGRLNGALIAPQVQDVQRCEVEIAPVRTNQPAGPSCQYVNNIPSDDFNDGNDEMCVEVLKNAESAGLCNTTRGKRVHVENTASRIKSKKARMDIANKLGFVEFKSAHGRKIVWYYAKNINNFENYISFFHSIKIELGDLLKSIVAISPIKFNLKLEATYNQPNVENSSQNRSFKTSARPIFIDSDITLLIDEAFTTLLHEEEIYAAKASMVDVEMLIEEIRKFPVLYDQTSEKYRNSEYKDRVWNNISTTLAVKDKST